MRRSCGIGEEESEEESEESRKYVSLLTYLLTYFTGGGRGVKGGVLARRRDFFGGGSGQGLVGARWA